MKLETEWVKDTLIENLYVLHTSRRCDFTTLHTIDGVAEVIKRNDYTCLVRCALLFDADQVHENIKKELEKLCSH
jgi:hypothetical protein